MNCVSGYRAFFPLKLSGSPRPNQPYEFIQLALNPNGYGPSGGNFAHSLLGIHYYFDFSMEELNRISVGGTTDTFLLSPESLALVNAPIPDGFFPEGYNTATFGTPRMGGHRINVSNVLSFAGNRANPGIVFGQYNGQLIFQEPVLFDEHLASVTGEGCDEAAEAGNDDCQSCVDLAQPEKYRRAGYYASRYCTTHNPGPNANIEFEISNFELKSASANNSASSNAVGALLVSVFTYLSYLFTI